MAKRTSPYCRLKAEKESVEKELDSLREGLRHLKGYLTSSKFHQDTTVQTADVLRRLEEADHWGE